MSSTPLTVSPITMMRCKTLLNLSEGDPLLVRNWCQFLDAGLIPEPTATEIAEKMRSDDLISFAEGVRQLKSLYDEAAAKATAEGSNDQ